MLKHLLVYFLPVFLITCTSQKELGSREKPIQFALVPGQDSAVLMENGKQLEKWILENSGLHVRMQVPVSYAAVVEAIGSQRVDAGATYQTPSEDGVPQDARRLVKTQFPDVYEKVHIVQKTDSIPSDPVVFRKDFPADIGARLIAALKSFPSTPEGAKALKNLYHLEGFKDSSDKDYEQARKILLEISQQVQEPAK